MCNIEDHDEDYIHAYVRMNQGVPKFPLPEKNRGCEDLVKMKRKLYFFNFSFSFHLRICHNFLRQRSGMWMWIFTNNKKEKKFHHNNIHNYITNKESNHMLCILSHCN